MLVHIGNYSPALKSGLDNIGLALLAIHIQTAKNCTAFCFIAPIETTALRNEGYSVKRD